MTTVTTIGARELARVFDPTRPRIPTPEQAAIIESDLAPAAVVAGAGSGKTETMATRVVWLVANGWVAPERVLGLTFTRKAAAELSERVRSRLAAWRQTVPGGAAPQGEPTVLTYAAYAGRLVTEHAVRIGEEPRARLLSAAADWQVARDVVGRWRGAVPEGFGTPATAVTRVIALAGRLADHLVDPAAVAAVDADLLALLAALPPGRGTKDYPAGSDKILGTAAKRDVLLPMVAAFLAAKRERGARDFADEMVLAARLAAHPPVRAAERERFAAVLLDEYQDTGHAQVEMLRRLFGDGHPVTAVGDPLQSIYGWRGASTGTMAGFRATFPAASGEPATQFELRTSWRNDVAVLDGANAVARPLQDATASVELVARPGAPTGAVRLARAETVLDEAAWVAASLRTAWDALPLDGTRTAAVLVRRRSQIPLLEQALRDAGLPVEVVDLGGLLTVPEVADVYATLKVVSDHTAGAALMRLLTGARWRVGVRDLQALQDRARDLLPDRGRIVDPGNDPLGEATHLVEALDDLGDAAAYSPEGHRRLVLLAGELRLLRSRAAAPLAELVADVERTLGLDVEVAARPEVDHRPDRGRAHLDRFLGEVSRFADEVEHATLPGLLAFLAAAEDEENGLGAGEIVVDAERVQVLTVHGAKGLEWDLVAVPGLVEGVFPGGNVDDDWLRSATSLPDTLRGDTAHIPHLDLGGIASRNEAGKRFEAYHRELDAVRLDEERRLAYVAFTRARTLLLGSGYRWDHTTKPRPPSVHLTELRDTPSAVTEVWAEDDDTTNPLADREQTAVWPIDPLGERRADVEAGAALVRAALLAPGPRTAPATGRGVAWAHDAELLLAERARLAAGRDVEVALPRQLSVSALVTLRRDPAELARQLRRRLPTPPNRRARRGTAFHEWLEQRWLPKAQTLLDVDELPGAADESVTTTGTAELAALRAAFEASEWAAREPHAVEVPFEMLVGGRVVRGRMDAVFTDGTDASGTGAPGNAAPGNDASSNDAPSNDAPSTDASGNDRWLVVDWKTGPPPTGAGADAVAVQLAAYRLAWADLAGVPVERVDAAFHHVLAGVTVRPAGLLDAEALRALVEGDTDPDPAGG